jgi:proline iminopeptidase
VGAPLEDPWKLAQEWPESELVVVEGEGHTGGPAMTAEIVAATDRARVA